MEKQLQHMETIQLSGKRDMESGKYLGILEIKSKKSKYKLFTLFSTLKHSGLCYNN